MLAIAVVFALLFVFVLVAWFVEHAQQDALLFEISRLKQENRRLEREIDAWKLKDQHSTELIESYT